MQQTATLRTGDRITANIIGDFGKLDNLAGVHVYLRRHESAVPGDRPDMIPLLSSGPVVAYPPGTANVHPQGTVEVSGVVPGAIVGGTYNAAYAIFFFKDKSQPVTVVSIDPDRDFSRTVADDPSVSPGPPTITDID
ncbi:MAG: hypothetical protein NVSMB5_15550 [Candidatus Velthaea sp.]